MNPTKNNLFTTPDNFQEIEKFIDRMDIKHKSEAMTLVALVSNLVIDLFEKEAKNPSKSLDEKIKVMQHYNNGGDVTANRVKVTDPLWDWSTTDYNVKSDLIERWGILQDDNKTFYSTADTKEKAIEVTETYNYGRIFLLREVNEDEV